MPRRPVGAEVVLERWCGWVHGGEDETVITGDLRDLTEAVLGHVEIALVEAVESRNADQVAGEVVGPPVIRAHEDLGVALVGAAHRVSAVRAGVEQTLDRAVLLTDREDVVETNRRLEEVPGLGDLRLVAKELPGPAEDELHLGVEDLLVAEDPPIDLTSLDRDEAIDGEGFGDRHDRRIPRPRPGARRPFRQGGKRQR